MTLLPQFRDQLQTAAEARTQRVRPLSRIGGMSFRMPRVVHGTPMVLSLLVAIGIAAGALVTLGDHTGAPSSAALSGGTSPRPLTQDTMPAWLSRLTERFPVLATPAARTPESVARMIRLRHPGLDVSRAHRVVLHGATVWIIATRSQMCLALVRSSIQVSLGSACTTTLHADKVGVRLLAHSSHPGQRWVAGVVPNDVLSLRIHHTTGATTRATVSHNVFVTATRSPIAYTHLVLGKPPYPTNASGQTYGSEAEAQPGQQPDLVAATGKALHGDGRVEGFVLRSQLNAGSCNNVKTPRQAVRCTERQANSKPRTIPLYAQNGKTVIGTFTLQPGSSISGGRQP